MARDHDHNEECEERVQIDELRREVLELRSMLGQVAQASSIEHVISNGFSELSEKLQPLRELTPHRAPLGEQAIQQLRQLRAALARPRWRGSNFEAERTNEHDYAGSRST